MKYNFLELETVNKETFDIDVKFQSDLEYAEVLHIISINIENYRDRYCLTQKRLAEKLHVSQEMISKLESGESNISIKKLVEIWNRLSNKEYDFTSRLLNSILQQTKENYNRLYCSKNYHYSLSVYSNTETKEINPEEYKQNISYNKKCMYS